MADTSGGRKVVANISLSLDGRVNGAGGDADMSWIVPHAITDGARDHRVRVTSPATTALLRLLVPWLRRPRPPARKPWRPLGACETEQTRPPPPPPPGDLLFVGRSAVGKRI
jgi:hypothetical protein